MHWVDWAIIGVYLLVVTAIGFWFIRRASGSVAEFFVAGRNLPWWLAGTSLVATSFAADTPLVVAGLIATAGIAGNWLWWNQVVAWTLAVVFFARLWRRAELVTDAEFIEQRYGGSSGAFLRGFKAVYTSVIFSTCTLAWVMLAMQKIVAETLSRPGWIDAWQTSLEGALGWTPGTVDLWKWFVLLALFGVATLYTALSGFWGIVVTDLFQFGVAMAAAIVFAVFAVDSVGGMVEMKARLVEQFGADKAAGVLNFIPRADSEWMPLSTFAVFLGVLWWGDCGNFAAQRMFSTRTERDSVLTALWYSIAHFALRPWPWVVVGLVALLYYPQIDDPESGYPRLMMEILPIGVRGVMIASLLAAFMSTVDTHLNWNASYFVVDIYQRFINPDAGERRCVTMSRWAVLFFAALALVVAYFMESIANAVVILFNLQAGIGLVLMLRWFWWRINAWSEISAMIASLVVTTSLPLISDHFDLGWTAAFRIVLTVALTTPTWLIVTFLTSPADPEKLATFYRKVRPARMLWGPVARQCPEVKVDGNWHQFIIGWVTGAVGLYALMFAIGKLVLLEFASAGINSAIAAACVFVLWLNYRNRANPLVA